MPIFKVILDCKFRNSAPENLNSIGFIAVKFIDSRGTKEASVAAIEQTRRQMISKGLSMELSCNSEIVIEEIEEVSHSEIYDELDRSFIYY